MLQTNTLTLRRRVERSRLLTPDRKKAVLNQISSLSPEQQEKLLGILDEESGVLKTLADTLLTKAVNIGDAGTLKKLDDFFAKTGKRLRKMEDSVERAGEDKQLGQLLDDINT